MSGNGNRRRGPESLQNYGSVSADGLRPDNRLRRNQGRFAQGQEMWSDHDRTGRRSAGMADRLARIAVIIEPGV